MYIIILDIKWSHNHESFLEKKVIMKIGKLEYVFVMQRFCEDRLSHQYTDVVIFRLQSCKYAMTYTYKNVHALYGNFKNVYDKIFCHITNAYNE